jgi:hypothetical protein
MVFRFNLYQCQNAAHHLAGGDLGFSQTSTIEYLNHQLKFFINADLICILDDAVIHKQRLQIKTELIGKHLAASKHIKFESIDPLHRLTGETQPFIEAEKPKVSAFPILLLLFEICTGLL